MAITTVSKQKQVVHELLAEVKAQSATTVAKRRALTDKRKAILGRPTVMIWAYAAGAYVGLRSTRKKSPELSAARAEGVSMLSLMNTGLALWAVLKRVDRLNQSNAKINLDNTPEEKKPEPL